MLEAAGLLDHERSGREVLYRVTPQPLASAVGWILDTAGLWDRRIDRCAVAMTLHQRHDVEHDRGEVASGTGDREQVEDLVEAEHPGHGFGRLSA